MWEFADRVVAGLADAEPKLGPALGITYDSGMRVTLRVARPEETPCCLEALHGLPTHRSSVQHDGLLGKERGKDRAGGKSANVGPDVDRDAVVRVHDRQHAAPKVLQAAPQSPLHPLAGHRETT